MSRAGAGNIVHVTARFGSVQATGFEDHILLPPVIHPVADAHRVLEGPGRGHDGRVDGLDSDMQEHVVDELGKSCIVNVAPTSMGSLR